MAAPNPSDLLNQVEYWTTSPESPLMAEVRKELAALEAKANSLDEKSPEFQKLNQEYQSKAAQLLLGKIQKQFGEGGIPNRKAMEDSDFKARSGGDAQAETKLREGSRDMPYARGYTILEQLQKAAATSVPQAKPASLTEPGLPTKLGPTPKKPALPKRQKPAETDDEKLTDTQLMLLYGMMGGGPDVAPTAADIDQPAPFAPSMPTEPMPTTPPATPHEFQRMQQAVAGSQAAQANTMQQLQSATGGASATDQATLDRLARALLSDPRQSRL